MVFHKILRITTVAIMLTLSYLGVAEAASISVDCRLETGVDRLRSKATVRGYGLARGNKYYAKIRSGSSGVWVSSKPKSGRRLEFEFDSHTDEIGKTIIPDSFLSDGVVVAVIRKFKKNGSVANQSSPCEIRNK
jgi:hypothetical protein